MAIIKLITVFSEGQSVTNRILFICVFTLLFADHVFASKHYASYSISVKSFLYPKTFEHQPYETEVGNTRSHTSFKIISASGATYGYEIIIGKKVLIKQTTIPWMPGVKGFATKSDAQKVATLMISKLKKGIMTPTVEKKELDKLRIMEHCVPYLYPYLSKYHLISSVKITRNIEANQTAHQT